MRFGAALFCISLLASTMSRAQIDNRLFDLNFWNDSIRGKQYGFQLQTLQFARNTEYTTKLAEGATLLGVQMIPTFNYKLHDSVQLSLGAMAHWDLGGDLKFIPVVNTLIRHKGHRFLFGSLEGSTTHGMIEPLYHFQGIINRRIEQGIQHKYSSKKFVSDVWVDWEKMIYPGSDFREEFTFGWVFQPNWITANKWRFSTPVQITGHHRGGEIDISNLPVESQFNFAYGADLQWNGEGRIRQIRLQGWLSYYEDISNTPSDSFIDGLGQLAVLSVSGKHSTFALQYWDSHQFQSVTGDPVYWSLSNRDQISVQNYRKIVGFRYIYQKELFEHLDFAGRMFIMSDLHQGVMDYVIEFYLKYNMRTGKF